MTTRQIVALFVLGILFVIAVGYRVMHTTRTRPICIMAPC